jgi:hypothetical protein
LRLALATLWVLLGSAITAGVYWAFLITPESTVGTLIVSGLLAIVALAMAGFTAAGAISIWSHGASLAGLRRAARAVAGVIPAAMILAIVWWSANHAEPWLAMRSGQINAWFIARFGWADVTWLFTASRYVANWFRWVVAPMLALSLMAGVVAIGWAALGQAAWVRRAFNPRALAIATFWFVLLIALPWMYLVPWRPMGLPASSMEFAFIVAKLSVSAILFAVGAALIAGQASRTSRPPTDPSSAVVAA